MRNTSLRQNGHSKAFHEAMDEKLALNLLSKPVHIFKENTHAATRTV